MMITAADKYVPATDRRGIVLWPEDIIDYPRWLELIRDYKINVLSLHGDYNTLVEFSRSVDGEKLKQQLARDGVLLEFAIHFMPAVMTYELYCRQPEWFPVDICGVRYWEKANPCTGTAEFLEFVAEQAAEAVRVLGQTSHRYQFWAGDGQPWCNCPECAGFSASDQFLRLLNAMLSGIKSVDPEGELAYLAYLETLAVPEKVRPLDGIFLTFAPYRRNMFRPLTDPECQVNVEHLKLLDGLLRFFPAENSSVLEYWLDASLFSYGRGKPLRQVAATRELFSCDVDFYRSRGIADISSFACRMSREYFEKWGTGVFEDYASVLKKQR